MYFKECFKSLLHTLYRLSALGPCGTPLPFSGSAFVHVNRRKYKTFLLVDILNAVLEQLILKLKEMQVL